MKEPITITCPHCGKETPAAAPCRNCGKDPESLQELEVQYRDFKGSEMLDIKMSPRPRQEAAQTAQTENGDSDKGQLSEKKRTGKKAVIFLTVVAIILSAVAWYYLLKFLL